MNFDNLLDFETIKIRELLFLLQSAYAPCSIEQLADKIGVNRKTLMKYIQKLQKLFDKYNFSDYLEIIKVSRNELYLHRENNIHALKFNVCYLLNTIEIRLLMFSFEAEVITFKEMAERLGISESLLRNRIQKLNDWLQSYELRLERQSYKLVGEESQIREFLFQFNQYFQNGIGRKEVKLHEDTFLLAESIHNFFELNPNDIQKNLLLELVNITVDRVKKGHPMDIQENWNTYIINSPWFTDFLAEMPCEIVSNGDLAYIFLIVQSKFSFLFSRVQQAKMIQDHFLRKTNSFQNTLLVVRRINFFFSEEKIKYETPILLSYLSFHLYYELVQSFGFETVDNTNQLYELYPKFMNNLEKAVADIQQKNTFFFNLEKNILVHRYFHILTAIISPLSNENKKYICLLTELPPEKEVELEQQLKNFFYNKINLKVVYGRNSQSLLYADVLLVSRRGQKIIEEISQPALLIEDTQLKLEELLEIEKILK
ncbi:helix-turn-helix domain-containing protein [Enterococcus rivorum]|uniref:Mga helix-turn-helix domain-containing protein n=1 Tax=Enterococcus rivorum TaxID=762845 RepID=A0A1E5KXF8_9ENTE|nr:helix-turn-helix domain-containing protein [Enterococcus rivorum]MBP2099918.1 biotin operon repressor [Enterococcus rivorum]OEH82551.1 hypothetical protein BCR26_12920 [Enterococcus rivorum]